MIITHGPLIYNTCKTIAIITWTCYIDHEFTCFLSIQALFCGEGVVSYMRVLGDKEWR